MRRLLFCFSLIATGCGPLTFPMVDRLSPEEQQQVDESWRNMLSPPSRLDRTLLLDVLIANQFHQQGIDRLTLVSEKKIGDCRVKMTVKFDREQPNKDEFTISHMNRWGWTLRRERYTGDEVRQRRDFLYANDCSERNSTQPAGQPEDASERRKREQNDARCRELQARQDEITAATQPTR